MSNRFAAFLIFSVPLLAACSGGGGGSASGPNPAAATQPPPPTSGIPVNLQAPSTTVTYQVAALTAAGAGNGMGSISLSALGQGPTVSLSTDSSGNLSRVVIPSGNIDNSVSGAGGTGRILTDPVTLSFGFQLTDTLAFPRSFSYSLSQVTAGQGLSYSAYGNWASTGGVLPGDFGVFALGNVTAPQSLPTTGSATFNGFTFGAGGATNSSKSDGSSLSAFKGNAQIIANFTTQSATTNLTNFTGATIPNLSGTSTISGNAYSGPITGGGLSGTINGNFYGAGAPETAGVWQAAGGGNAFIGSFGAR